MPFDKSMFLAADDRPMERVETPEWADAGVPAVWVRTMSGVERDAFEAELFAGGGEKPSMANYRARLLVRCMADEQGNRLFDDDDAPAVGRKSAKVLDRLIDVARRLNGVTKADEAASVKN